MLNFEKGCGQVFAKVKLTFEHRSFDSSTVVYGSF